MYLRGNKWSMTRRSQRPNLVRIGFLILAIAAGLYVNQVVVPTTQPLFVPTPTPTHSPESYINEAEEYYQAGKIPQAIEAYKNAINTDPTNPSNYVALARLQVFDSEYEEAVKNAQNALLKNPNNPTAHAVQGWALGFLSKYTESEIELKKAMDLDPRSGLPHAFYAEMLLMQNDAGLLDKAIDESKKARDLDPNSLETHRARGIVLMNTQNLAEAVQEFQAALAINKNIADLHLNLGVTYKMMNKFDLAQESLLSAYALNPKDTVALTELSRSFFADGRFAQAAQYAEEAVKVNPVDPRLHGNLGIMYYKQGEFAKAIPELSLAIRGGQAGEDVNVEGLPLDYGRVEEYYWYLGFAFAKSSRCGEAVPIAQALITGVANDEIAVYNANEILNACAQSLGTELPPTLEEGTGTPEPAAKSKTKLPPEPTKSGGNNTTR